MRASRSLATIAAIAVIAASIVVPSLSAGASPALSGTFASWSPYSVGGASVVATVDRSTRHGGAVALRFVNSSTRAGGVFGGMTQAVPATPNTTYVFSAWVKTSGAPSANANSFLVNASWTPATAVPAGDLDWRNITWEYVTSASETSLPFALLSQDKGTIWLDDMSIVKKGTATNLLANPGFEDAADTIRIITPDLLLAQGAAATVSVDSSAASVAWAVTNSTGAQVAAGTVSTSTAAATIGLSALAPGYYTLKLTAGATVRTTNVAVVGGLSKKPVVATSPFGVTLHPNVHGALEQSGIIADLGLGNARLSLRWETTETTPGVYVWDPNVDAEILRLNALGIKPIGILAYSNANYDGGKTPSSAAGIQAFANFAQAAAQRYGTTISYEIYNEWNASTNDGACGLTPECYLKLLAPTATAIRSVAPTATIVGPVLGGLTAHWLTTNESFNWLKRFLDLGGLDIVDVVSIHNYGFPSAPEGHNNVVIAKVKTLLKAYPGGSTTPLWLTETGWSTVGGGGVDETQQANYLVRDAVLSVAAGVDKYFVYDLLDDWADPSNFYGRFGMFRNPTQESGSLVPKLAAVAFATMTRELDGFRFVKKESIATGVSALLFVNAAGVTKRVLWAPTAKQITVSTTASVTVSNQLASSSVLTPSAGKVVIALGPAPVYLTGGSPTMFQKLTMPTMTLRSALPRIQARVLG